MNWFAVEKHEQIFILPTTAIHMISVIDMRCFENYLFVCMLLISDLPLVQQDRG